MNKPIIAVDMDDVLAGHAEAFVAFSNATYGTHLTVEDYSDHWDRLWRVEQEEIERRAAVFHIPETTLQYRANQSAKRTLKKLSDRYTLVVVTARSKGEVDITYQWIKMHFTDVFSGVHFVPIWEANNKTTKADICRQIGAQYLVDDLVRHCNTAAEAGITALLFGDYPWNRNEAIAQGVYRVKDWQAVENFLMNEVEPGFRERVEMLVRQIPRGRVMTYGQLAALCGNARAARIVGGIAHFGDPDLPWQRVVNKQGGLAAGYPGGRGGHRAALEAEGIDVSEDYKIDIARLLWHPGQTTLL